MKKLPRQNYTCSGINIMPFKYHIPNQTIKVICFNSVWGGLLLFILLRVDCGQVFAFSYAMNQNSADQIFVTNTEGIYRKIETSAWVGFYADGQERMRWRSTPPIAPLEIGSPYEGNVDIEPISTSQTQLNMQFPTSSEVFPIPESSTLLLMGIGLLGIGGLIRWETAKKRKKTLFAKEC